MSALEVHDWLQLGLAERQRHIREYYDSNGHASVHHFLGLVRAPHGKGVYASIGPNYQYAIFGRDSIAVADDLLEMQPDLSKEIIVLLAELQGRQLNPKNEEEPGKIIHEYRSLNFNGHRISDVARDVLHKIGPPWGASADELKYYGSYDATPLFITLVARYCRTRGDSILGHKVPGQNDVRAAVHAATIWLAQKIAASPWGLLEFKRLNPEGLLYQAWEDSSLAYIHTDGSAANADGGIAAIELQGYAYDALNAAASLVAVSEDEANAWRQMAESLRAATLKELWMPEQKYFCMGLDRTSDGATRQIATLTANPALLLTTSFFDGLEHDVAWLYIEAIVRQVLSEEFLTPAGLRVRARQHAGLVAFADYHGSLVSWPKHTHQIAGGLRRHGFNHLAALLDAIVLQSVAQAGEFYEFFFVDTENKAKYHYRQENPDEPGFHEFGAANTPEPGQAWTISAVLRTVNARFKPDALPPATAAARQLDAELLSNKYVAEIAITPSVRL